ncbi:hypothetical protein P153DRAFT_312462 [Dothidotthia symphoricarpi CBS 119687]|uniref:DNA replication regulator Sld3 C-terminal domain-containing protein n=1 Tax=Dothidotthia symphoricarpi CBS 119687 TaxID=1392245 RepID=A0A6A6AMR2_9PLEO|nr:uncharacterized protein P153DRAFT_312462 [Dothidotthia symphoricarpi CBS 119687]KAF2131771.1 hypothetical protein P153DRAFT_312462 [Dothidotthia symphoricarpi CBS 119687]
MSSYASQTKTMLQSSSKKSTQILGLTATRDEAKAPLPSKRRREAICGLGTFNKPFTIKPYPSSPYDKPATFKPVRIIGRAQFPLTFLDTSSDDTFAANCLFSAYIDVLEDGNDAKPNDYIPPRVLIARHESKKTLYAIERVRPRVYSICKIAQWLKEKDVAELWDPSILALYPAMPASETSNVVGGQWWQHAITKTQPVERPLERARITMMRCKPEPELVEEESQMRRDTPIMEETEVIDSAPNHLFPEPTMELPSPPDQLESLRQLYLEAVYLSKTSLAYFAKGPIARIRNAFTSPEEGAPPTHELVTFLRSMLLSPKASEKKYYEKLPSLIKSIPPGSYSDEDIAAKGVKTKRSKKKMKLTRDGVYPQEEIEIRKWWMSEMPNSENNGQETIEQRIKRRIGDMRVRETLAQLTLMLEIIALEALSTYKPPPGGSLVDETQTQEESQIIPNKRKKKLDDINLQLDLLLDRLCIWHATEEAGILDFEADPSKQNGTADGSGKGAANDRLHGFCVEVIIPFYMNRLPEQALMINKKLGGPAHSLPSKRKAMRPPVTSRKSGELKDREIKKSRRSLARVATDTIGRTGERVTPSFNRAATDSILVDGIKREGSEAPLSAIPFHRSPSKGARQSMSQLKHLQGRQIDLTTTSAAATAKMKQKQRVEEDLKEAISALKKPNRGLAVGGYMADVERRGISSTDKSRKPANPVRKVVRDVQVTATPRAGRKTRDMIGQTPTHYHSNPFVRQVVAEAPPPSSDFCVPSSGVRPPPFMMSTTVQRNTISRTQPYEGIAETPSKAPNTRTFSSGTARRSIFETPVKGVPSSPDRWPPVAPPVFETPVKSLDNSLPISKLNIRSSPDIVTPPRAIALPDVVAGSSPPKAGEASIYDALGWNDDDDML